jgi:ATP/maltotriose-dependent transcriptional regulator MalT
VFKAETGDLDASLADYQEVLSLARASGDNYTLVVTLVNLGVDQVAAGEFPAAPAYLQDALRVADAHGYQHLSAAAEMNLGFAYLLSTSDHARLRDALREAAFDAAYARGRTLSQADAIALAVGTAQPDPGPAPAVTDPAVHCAPADSPAGPLSARERQIMALLSGGASNAKIAETLFVTPNTVRTHLDQGQDRRPQPRRTDPLRHTGGHRSRVPGTCALVVVADASVGGSGEADPGQMSSNQADS